MNEQNELESLVVISHGFSPEKFKSYTVQGEDRQFVSFSDLAKKSLFELFRFLRIRRKSFYVALHSNIKKETKYLYTTLFLLFLTNAHSKGFIDDQGKIERIGGFDFVPIFVRMIGEAILAVPFILATWTTLFMLRFLMGSVLRHFADKGSNKKVIFLRTDADTGSRVGGSYSHISGFTGGLKKLGYETVFLGDYLPLENSSLDNRFFRIPFLTFFHLPEIPDFLYNFTFFFRALPILKKEKPITFLYHRNSFGNCAGVMLARALGVPLIYEFNGSEAWARQFWGGRLFFKRLAYLFEDISFRGADIIAVVSQPLKDELSAKGVTESKIIVNPNGVDFEKFNPDIDGIRIRQKYGLENKIVVGFVGTFGPWHGADVFAKAIRSVVAVNPNIHVMLVGDGAMRPKVEEIISRDGVGEFVVMVGATSHKDMPVYLAACDILVNPTVPNEDGSRFFGSPTKLFEYMAMGKAIVASDLEQIGQVLRHEETALLVKPGDTGELAQGILRFAQDKELRERLGSRARKEVIKHYTWEMNAKRVVEAFHNLRKDFYP